MSTSNVTVNGRPVEEFTSEQIGKEIRDVRTADQNVPVHRPVISKRKNSNQSHARASAGRSVLGSKDTKATHVMIRGELFDWLEKSIYGYTPSGYSIFGLLEVCDKTQEIKCHHCGEWHRKLGRHITWQKRNHPGLRDYKLTHGLLLSTAPMHPAARAACAARAKTNHEFGPIARPIVPRIQQNAGVISADSYKLRRQFAGPDQPLRGETANLVLGCQKQTLTKLVNYAAVLGRAPTSLELRNFTDEQGKHPLNPGRLRNLLGVGLRAVYARVGLTLGKRNVTRKRKRIGPLLDNSQFFTNATAVYRAQRRGEVI